MDRDAVPAAESVSEVVPPLEWLFVRKVGFVGLGMLAGAAVLALVATAMGSPPWVIHTARLWLVFVGVITVGSAVSMRPDLWQTWAIGAGAGLLAVAGTPAHWDSFRLLFGVFTAVSLAWTLTLLAPWQYRLPILSAALLFHFTGIFFATTTPPPTPWVTEQMYTRVYNPYLQFIYMRNAYHFYSPEPGPASVIVCLLKTETGTDAQGKKQYDTRWYVLPKRPSDVKDPLGLTYYRRLSITEQLARASPGLVQGTHAAERAELLPRRQAVTYLIPTNPGEELVTQYRLPDPTVMRFILPSYASHIILENTDRESAGKTTVKIYRLEHQTLNVEAFVNPRNRSGAIASAYHPSTYRPYFLGEYGFVSDPNRPGSTRIELLHSQEPLLYWLVPITSRQGFVGPDKRDFVDNLSIHALFNVIETGERNERGQPVEFGERHVDDKKYRDRVFDWDQLR